jgi:hypothetical protein
MTHLSDYSYIDRGIAVLFYMIASLIYLYNVDNLSAFNYEKLRVKKDPKSICTVLLFISMLFSVIYDGVATYFKYAEGYSLVNGGCILTPRASYSQRNKDLVTVADLMLDISWSLKSCALFLLQIIWNYVAKHYNSSGGFSKLLWFV